MRHWHFYAFCRLGIDNIIIWNWSGQNKTFTKWFGVKIFSVSYKSYVNCNIIFTKSFSVTDNPFRPLSMKRSVSMFGGTAARTTLFVHCCGQQYNRFMQICKKVVHSFNGKPNIFLNSYVLFLVCLNCNDLNVKSKMFRFTLVVYTILLSKKITDKVYRVSFSFYISGICVLEYDFVDLRKMLRHKSMRSYANDLYLDDHYTNMAVSNAFYLFFSLNLINIASILSRTCSSFLSDTNIIFINEL